VALVGLLRAPRQGGALASRGRKGTKTQFGAIDDGRLRRTTDPLELQIRGESDASEREEGVSHLPWQEPVPNHVGVEDEPHASTLPWVVFAKHANVVADGELSELPA